MSSPVIDSGAYDQVWLDVALLCQDCKTISRGLHGACVACASLNVLPLAPVLDRDKARVGDGDCNASLRSLRDYIQKHRNFNFGWIALHLRDGHPAAAERRREEVVKADGWLAALDCAIDRAVESEKRNG